MSNRISVLTQRLHFIWSCFLSKLRFHSTFPCRKSRHIQTQQVFFCSFCCCYLNMRHKIWKLNNIETWRIKTRNFFSFHLHAEVALELHVWMLLLKQENVEMSMFNYFIGSLHFESAIYMKPTRQWEIIQLVTPNSSSYSQWFNHTLNLDTASTRHCLNLVVII